MRPLQPGDTVQTPRGAGTFVYQRMAPPDYTTPEAISVRLNARSHDASYTGTMFPAADVTRIVTPPARIDWLPTTEDKYHEMLNILPPAAWVSGAFLVGEPVNHCEETGRPRFDAYWQRGSEYVVSSRAITIRELRTAILDHAKGANANA